MALRCVRVFFDHLVRMRSSYLANTLLSSLKLSTMDLDFALACLLHAKSDIELPGSP